MKALNLQECLTIKKMERNDVDTSRGENKANKGICSYKIYTGCMFGPSSHRAGIWRRINKFIHGISGVGIEEILN